MYAGWLTDESGTRHPAAISVGTNPTFDGLENRQVEAHVIDRPQERVEDFDLYGQHVVVELSAENRHAVFVPVGFAHGFAALSDATVMYVTTSEYDPEIERELNPCDPALAIEWGVAEPIMSEKDVAAVSLADAQSLGVLPTFEACTEYETMLRDAWVLANEEAVQ